MKITLVLAATVAMSMGLPYADARGGGGGGHGGGGWGNKNGQNSTQPGNGMKGSLLQTVKQGQLSDKEVEGLKAQLEALQKAADGYAGEGKLTKEEIDTFEETFDAASFYIWSKGADDEGKVSTRYGTATFPVESLAKMLDADTLTKPQAKILVTALKSIVAAKLKLNGEMAPEARASLQKQFNESLVKYFRVM